MLKKDEEAIRELGLICHMREGQIAAYAHAGEPGRSAECKERLENLWATLAQLLEEEKKA